MKRKKVVDLIVAEMIELEIIKEKDYSEAKRRLEWAWTAGYDSGRNLKMGRKSVIQMDAYGNKVDEYQSITLASENTGIPASSISKVLNNRRHTAGGSRWVFADEE